MRSPAHAEAHTPHFDGSEPSLARRENGELSVPEIQGGHLQRGQDAVVAAIGWVIRAVRADES